MKGVPALKTIGTYDGFSRSLLLSDDGGYYGYDEDGGDGGNGSDGSDGGDGRRRGRRGSTSATRCEDLPFTRLIEN